MKTTLALIVAGLFALVFFVFLFKKIRPVWKKLLGLGLSFLACLTAFVVFMLPFNPNLPVTGKAEVTTSKTYLVHETAYPNMKTNDSSREIPVRIWMPRYPQGEKMSLVVFSHGSFGVPESNESLFNELASHGYMVASLAHPHHSFRTTLSNHEALSADSTFIKEVMSSQGSGDLVGTMERFQAWNGIRVEDLNSVIDYLLENKYHDGLFDLIDPNRIFLAGHSLGGSAVLAVGRERPELFKGVIVLEAPFFGDITGIEGDHYVFTQETYPLPVLHFYSDALWGRLNSISTYEMNQRLIDLKDPKFKTVHVEGSGHIGLTDMVLVSPFLTNVMDHGLNTNDPYDNLAIINQESLAFLEDLKRQ